MGETGGAADRDRQTELLVLFERARGGRNAHAFRSGGGTGLADLDRVFAGEFFGDEEPLAGQGGGDRGAVDKHGVFPGGG